MSNRMISDSLPTPTEPSQPGGEPKRIVLYSHDTMGLGHMRRNLLIAQALTGACHNASVLLIAGAREIHRFELPCGVDCITLPGLHKDDLGQYRSRHLSLSLPDLLAMRRDTIRAVVASFRPHAIVVDKVAQGVGGELIPTLTQQHACGTRCILGLRDILDEPSVVQREWEAAGGDTWIDEIYDHIWIYGDPLVYDAVHEYGFTSSVARKIQYTGYLDQVVRSEASELAHDEAHGARHSPCRNVTCVLGGGQDGAKLAEAFCRTDFGNRWHGTLITGPFMPEPELSRLRQLVSGRTDITLIPFASDAERYIRCADRVISMGGYNTVCSILSHNRHALVVPRTQPRQEQWIRATRLQNLGLLSTIDPEQLTSVAIRQWLDIDLPDPPDVRRLVDLNGLGRVADWFRQLPTSHRCTPGTHARRFADERRDPPHAHLSAHRSGQQSPDGYSVWL